MSTYHEPLHDALSERRAAQLTALLDAELSDDLAARASAERMRPAILAAARQAAFDRQRRLLLRAAVLALAIAGVAAAPPVRAWVVDRLAHIAGLSRSDAEPAAEPAPAPTADSRDGDVRFSFAAATPTLTVHLEANAGTLVVRRSAEPLASLEVVGTPARLVVLQDGVRVVSGAAAADALFILSAPQQVRSVRLIRADGSSLLVPVGDVETRTRIGGR